MWLSVPHDGHSTKTRDMPGPRRCALRRLSNRLVQAMPVGPPRTPPVVIRRGAIGVAMGVWVIYVSLELLASPPPATVLAGAALVLVRRWDTGGVGGGLVQDNGQGRGGFEPQCGGGTGEGGGRARRWEARRGALVCRRSPVGVCQCAPLPGRHTATVVLLSVGEGQVGGKRRAVPRGRQACVRF